MKYTSSSKKNRFWDSNPEPYIQKKRSFVYSLRLNSIHIAVNKLVLSRKQIQYIVIRKVEEILPLPLLQLVQLLE